MSKIIGCNHLFYYPDSTEYTRPDEMPAPCEEVEFKSADGTKLHGWFLRSQAEVVHGTPTRFSDPARFSMAHGGKDGQPFPVPVDVFDHTLATLRQAVDAARLGNDDRLQALERLDRQARQLEQHVELEGEPAAGFDAFIDTERRRSPQYGGRTVFGPAGRPRPPKPRRKAGRQRRDRQLVLPGLGSGDGR